MGAEAGSTPSRARETGSDPFGRAETGSNQTGGAEARGDKTRGAETGGDQTGEGKTAAASPPAATSSPAAAEQRRRLPQLSLWQRARGEGGGARHLLGGVQHLWQEVGAREIPNTSLRRQIQSNTKHSNNIWNTLVM